jgi:hypothetical protein
VELTEKLIAFGDFHSLGFPQREDAERRRAITPALVAMTVTHVERLTGRFDLHRPAVTSAFTRHTLLFKSVNQEAKKIESGRIGRRNRFLFRRGQKLGSFNSREIFLD